MIEQKDRKHYNSNFQYKSFSEKRPSSNTGQ